MKDIVERLEKIARDLDAVSIPDEADIDQMSRDEITEDCNSAQVEVDDAMTKLDALKLDIEIDCRRKGVDFV
jgi:hypothetical protein